MHTLIAPMTAMLAALALLANGCASRTDIAPPPVPTPTTPAASAGYHGWPGALRLTNDQAEVVIVPEIGRVMSFRLRDGENVFWEDCSLDGKRGDAGAKEWINFGGDKTWPAPEADWGKVTGRKFWMPPAAFDALPVEARMENGAVIMTSLVDPYYGIRTVRHVQLFGSRLRINTSYERVSGEPLKVAVWTITQFREPVAVGVPVLANSMFSAGYYAFDTKPWPQLQTRGKFLKITRDPLAAHKLGSDASELLWLGEKEACLVSTTRVPGAEYPDRGASAEVYTNPDPKKYVELELLSPLSVMKPGDTISLTVTYQLVKRGEKSVTEELAGWLAQ